MLCRLIIDESYIFLTNKPEKNLDLKQGTYINYVYICVGVVHTYTQNISYSEVLLRGKIW